MKVTWLDPDKPWEDYVFEKRPGKSVCIVRYGGFGDMIQMSSVLPWLKEQGYYITVNTSEVGADIMKHDPHVDELFLQVTDQVPNTQLWDYWQAMAGAFSKFIQFSESVEGSLLALPDRPEYLMSKKKRHKKMNRNYLSHMHAIAKVPKPPRPKFYPSEEESHRADQYIKDLAGDFTVMWSLSGSSVHKAWPYTDNVIAKLFIDHPGARVIFVGDALCQLLEEQWRHESRLKRECGRMPIRDTLALSQKVDLVVGPETGVLNCVAFEDVHKILMLSHSSKVNLGGSWKNATVFEPKRTPCYPCHKLHFGWKTCTREELTGGALCAANISPVNVYNAVRRAAA